MDELLMNIANGASRHPRSALGFNDDKLFLIAIDGREPGYSMGMTLYDMGKFFQRTRHQTRHQLRWRQLLNALGIRKSREQSPQTAMNAVSSTSQ